MKFAEKLSAHLTPEWRIQYIQYEKLKEIIYDAFDKMPPKDAAPASTIQRYLKQFEDQWFKFCDEELEKINTFYAEKLAEANRKLTALKNELYVVGGLKSGQSLSTIKTGQNLTLAPLKMKKSVNKKKIGDMKLAFSEFYLSLALLQNYQQLNFTGFRKILKKHDKIFDVPSGVAYRVSSVEQAPFFKNKHIDQLIFEVESIVINELEGGNRSKAMNRLRVPPLGEEAKDGGVLCRVGFFSGVFLMVMTVVVITGFYTEHEGEWPIMLRLYRGFFLLFLCTFLLAVNTYGWRKNGVNHVLIFELDPRNHLSYQQLLEVAGLMAVLWALSLAAFMFGNILQLDPYVPSLALGCFVIAFTFNPLRICYFSARFWLLRILFRILTAPFQHVGFADFWMADQLNSLVVALLDFQYVVCFYAYDWHVDRTEDMVCHTNVFGIRPFVACLPAWFRFAQCLRRYRDTKHAFPHLVNAGKYSTSFFVIVFSTLAKTGLPSSGVYFYLWIVAAFLSTCYTLTWDLKMDWGLLDKNAGPENRFLREETVYRYSAFYYFAMVEDFVFRFLWTMTVSVGDHGIFHSEVLKTVLAVCEVFRRFIWNFLRLENEHLNNCGQFRAVRDISVMPIDASDDLYIEQMMDDNDGPVSEKKKNRKISMCVGLSMRRLSSNDTLNVYGSRGEIVTNL